MTRVKVCGITNVDNARAAVDAGADALGFVFAPSPRRIEPVAAREIIRRLPPFVVPVGVFVDMPTPQVHAVIQETRIAAVQLHGQESPRDCADVGLPVVKRFPVFENDTPERLRSRANGFDVAAFMLDPGAGDGRTFRWEAAIGLPGLLIVAGGLTPDNVAHAIRLLRPYAVDVLSGVESAPGRKNPRKMCEFIQAVRNADGNGGA